MGSRRDPKAPWRPCQRRYGVESLLGAGTYFLGEGALRRSAVIFTGRGTASGQGCRRGAFFGEGGDGGIPAGGRAGGGGTTPGGGAVPLATAPPGVVSDRRDFPQIRLQTPGGSDLFATGWLLKICCFLLFFIFFSYLFFPLPASGAPKVNVSFIASSDLVS